MPHTPSPWTPWAHKDAEGVAVWDLIVDQALEVDGLQLEVDGDVDQPGEEGSSEGEGTLPRPVPCCRMLTLQLAEEVLTQQASAWAAPAPALWGSGCQGAPRTPGILPPPTLCPALGRPLDQAVLVEFEREVLVTWAAIQERQIITGGHKGFLGGVHTDAI